MKRYFALCLILATSFSLSANELDKEEYEETKYIRVRLGGSLPGQLKSEIDTLDTGIGVEAMVEGVYRPSAKTEVASGIGFQGHGNMETNYGTQSTFYSIPFYVSLKSNILEWPLYGKILGGASFNFKTDDFDYKYANGLSDVKYEHGYYWGAGLGIDIGNAEVEALYSVNAISFAYTMDGEEKNSGRVLDQRITLSVSYAFELKK